MCAYRRKSAVDTVIMVLKCQNGTLALVMSQYNLGSASRERDEHEPVAQEVTHAPFVRPGANPFTIVTEEVLTVCLT